MDWEVIKAALQVHTSDAAPMMAKINEFNLKKAAVLILLFEFEGKTYVVLTKRSARLKSHSGEVCCPGGKQDETDLNLEATALRETYEEIGIPGDKIEILGSLVPLFSKNKLLVTPVVGVLRDYNDIKLAVNEHEVDDTFACELEIFSSESGRFLDKLSSHVSLYSYSFKPQPQSFNTESEFLVEVFNNLKYDNYIIFGLTAHFLATLLKIVHNAVGKNTYDVDTMYAQCCQYVLQKAEHLATLVEQAAIPNRL